MRKILKYAALALLLILVVGGITLYIMSRPDVARFSTAELSGRVPVMASQRTESFPTINVPEATSWPAGQAPRAAQGLVRAARAWALLAALSAVLPDDVQAVWNALALHRLELRQSAEGGRAARDTLLRAVLESVPVPR